jgi:hypothetical protein
MTNDDTDGAIATDLEERLSALLDDKDFQNIDQRLHRFNIFEALDSIRGELRHSNFLAFILSPTRPHGLGSNILSRLLRKLIAKLPPDRRGVSVLEIALADLDTTLVEREHHNIDVLVEMPSIPLVMIIENKIFSAESKGQLIRYKDVVKQRFPAYHKLYVFLTPDGATASDPEYLSLSYTELASIVEEQVEEPDSSLRDDARLVLSHYVEMLRRHIVDDTRLQSLARQLYERHREAFEFVFKSRPEPDDVLEPLQEIIEADPMFVLDRTSPRRVRFALSEWTNYKELNSCPSHKWTRTGRSLLFELQAHRSSPRVNISLILGPADDSVRKYIFSEASNNPSLFIGLTKPLGRDTSTIFVQDFLSASAPTIVDEATKKEEIEVAWKKFATNDLLLLNTTIDQILNSYRAKLPSSEGNAPQ